MFAVEFHRWSLDRPGSPFLHSTDSLSIIEVEPRQNVVVPSSTPPSLVESTCHPRRAHRTGLFTPSGDTTVVLMVPLWECGGTRGCPQRKSSSLATTIDVSVD